MEYKEKYKFKLYFDEYCMKYERNINYLLQSESKTKIEEYRNAIEDNVDVVDLIDKVDKKVVHSGKENIRSFILGYYKYLLDIHHIDVGSNLKDRKLISDKLRREIEVAKFLHKKPTREEVKKEFSLESRTLSEYLGELKDGIEFLDTEIRLDIRDIESHKLECVTTMHPIFLSLNLTELWALTKYLPKEMKKNNINNSVIDSIINRVKSQLTDYALETLKLTNEENQKLQFKWEDKKLFQDKDHMIGYMIKSRCLCSFIIGDEVFEGQLLDYQTILVDGKEKNIGNIMDIDYFIKEGM